jgi:hypothetical protein
MNNPSRYRHCDVLVQQLRFQQNSEGGVMVHRAILVAILASAAALLPRLANAQSDLVGFKMPSNNIYCMLEPADENNPVSDLRCDIQQMTSKPPPAPKNCPLSWGDAFTIAQDGNMGVRICHGDTTKDDELPVVAYGREWNQSGFLCKSATSGLTCTNSKGHGFLLSRVVQKLF